jgi:hypothetical protein
MRSRRPPKIPSRFTGGNPFGGNVSQRQQPVRKHRVLRRAVATNLEEHDVDRTTTVKMQRMKEPYGEGLASHTGSESCGHDRKVRYEA